MIIDVEIYTSTLAEVVTSPAWWRRLLLREHPVTRFAVRRGGLWCWDVGGRTVDALTGAKIAVAVVAAEVRRRRERVASGVEPPG